MNSDKPLKPGHFAESQLMKSILSGKYVQGSLLPGERDLARQLGITRPTVRETLHKLASEGWITIQHGKQTAINNYWETGGLSLLSTLIKYNESFSPEFILNLLEVRHVIFPALARASAKNNPSLLYEHLKKADLLTDDPESFMDFDWKLQRIIARESGNPIWTLLLNDFEEVFGKMAAKYFSISKHRTLSRIYYREFTRAIAEDGDTVESVVKSALKHSTNSWKELITSLQNIDCASIF